MIKQKLIKGTIIFFVIFLTLLYLVKGVFLSKKATKKSKATNDSPISLSAYPSSFSLKNNEDGFLTLKIKANQGQKMIRGYRVYLYFDNTKLRFKNIAYWLGQPSEGLGDTNNKINYVNKRPYLRLVGESNISTGQLITTNEVELAKITFTNIADRSSINIHGFFYQIEDDYSLTESQALVKVDINGGGSSSPPITITSNPGSSTGKSSFNVKINLKAKFQGINKKVNPSILNVKAKLKKENTNNFLETTSVLTVDNNGVWSGELGFNIDNPEGKWILYIKGPKHLQKKVCDPQPSESQAGIYHCENANLTLKKGITSINLTGILLLSGDLDQNGVVDAVDIAIVKNNLGKKDEETLKKADVNLDSVIDTQDYSLILAALSVKTDE